MAAFRAWGRFALGAAGAIAIGVVAFGCRQPVPGLDQFDLGMHEVGHLLAGFMPRMFMFLSGSVLQVAVPLGLAAYFLLRRKDGASAGFCLAWAGTSARDVAVYVADAPVQALPLIGGGTHDWAYLLGPQGFDCIDSAGAIARSVEMLGLLMVIGGVGVCLWPPAWRLWERRRARVAPAAALVAPQAAAADEAGDPWLAAAALPFQTESRAGTGSTGTGRGAELDEPEERPWRSAARGRPQYSVALAELGAADEDHHADGDHEHRP